MIRVLVVDDSPLQRQLLVETLKQDSAIEVVGTAANGVEAVQLVASLRPDLVTMDIQMPEMDGYAATEEIMEHHPTPIVIVSGSKSRPDMDKTMNSLKAGALTIVHKPSSVQSSQFNVWVERFLETVKSMAEVRVIRRRRRPRPPVARELTQADRLNWETPPKVVAIVSSTGGPQALHRLISVLPTTFPLPILVVQHISSGFLTGFVSWLRNSVPLPVKVATDQESIEPGTVYLAPEDQHMGVTSSGRIQFSTEPPVEGFRPSGTTLFRSVAAAYGRSALALILTGMGRDGVDGLQDIRKAHGRVIAQDESSSVVFGMPRAAIEAGLANEVLSLNRIAAVLCQLSPPG